MFGKIWQQSSRILLWLQFATNAQQLLARDQALVFECLLLHGLMVSSLPKCI